MVMDSLLMNRPRCTTSIHVPSARDRLDGGSACCCLFKSQFCKWQCGEKPEGLVPIIANGRLVESELQDGLRFLFASMTAPILHRNPMYYPVKAIGLSWEEFVVEKSVPHPRFKRR